MNGDLPVNGRVFEDFIAVLEDRFGLEVVDTVLDQPGLASGGVYTADGNYDECELITLVNAFVVETGSQATELMHDLGVCLFAQLISRCPALISGQSGSLDLMTQIEKGTCPREVGTYLDSSVLNYAYKYIESGELLVKTSLASPLRHTVIGFFAACAKYFNESLSVDVLSTDESTIVLSIESLSP